jgi:flagellar biogenesis protein FliO
MTYSLLFLQPTWTYYSTILAFLFVLGLAFYSTKWIAKSKARTMQGKNIQVVERLFLSTDKHLLIVKVGEVYYFLSQDKSSIRSIDKLENFIPQTEEETQKFSYFLDKIKKNRKES